MRKIAGLCLALVLALGSLGMGYAAWTEDLVIGGTVTTGNLDVHFSAATPTPGTVVGVGTDSLTWTVIAAFPGQAINLAWTITNIGTVPAVVTLVGESITPAVGISISTTGLPSPILDPGEAVSGTTTVTITSLAPELTEHLIDVDIRAATP